MSLPSIEKIYNNIFQGVPSQNLNYSTLKDTEIRETQQHTQQVENTQKEEVIIIEDCMMFRNTRKKKSIGSEDNDFCISGDEDGNEIIQTQTTTIQQEDVTNIQEDVTNIQEDVIIPQEDITNLQEDMLPFDYLFNSIQFNDKEVKEKDNGWESVEATMSERNIKDYIQSARPTEFLNVNTEDLVSLFKCFFSDEMIQLLVNGTNERAQEYLDSLVIEKENTESLNEDKNKFKWKKGDNVEMCAYLAVIIYVGSCRCSCSINDLFSEAIGLPFVRICFSRKRFGDINRFLRCDLKAERLIKEENGVLFPIVDEMMSLFQKNCLNHAIPSEIVAVDERMCSFRGRTPLRMYMPNKPDKFGMLMHCLVDYESKYCFGISLYLGKSYVYNGHFGQSIVENLVKKLPRNKHFILGCDQLFTTFNLCQNMKKRNIDIIGTVNASSTSLPSFCKENLVLEHKKKVESIVKEATNTYNKAVEDHNKYQTLQQKEKMNKKKRNGLKHTN